MPAPIPRAHWATIGLFILAIGATVVLARAFLIPAIFAFLLSLTFSPIRRVLARRGIPSGITAALVVIGLFGLVVAVLLGLSAPIQTYASDMPAIIRDVEFKLRGISEAAETVAQVSDQVENMAGNAGAGTQTVVVEDGGLLPAIAAGAPYVLAQIVLTLALLFFLIASGDMFYEKIVKAVPRFSDKRRAMEIAFDVERKLSRYFLTITVINAGLGCAVGGVLYLLGMPSPVLFGVMAFVLNYIPYLGAVVGAVIAGAIGLVTYDQVGSAGIAVLAYLSLTSLEGQFVTPYAVGRSLKLNPVVVFLAVAFWGWAWSVIGMVIAVPVLITVRAFAEHVPRLQGLGLFLSGRAEQVPPDDTEDASGSTKAGAAG